MPNYSQSLDDWLSRKSSEAAQEFPIVGNVPTDYVGRLGQVRQLLGNFVHPEVNHGALWNESGYLTDHGPAHIKTVARRASEIVFGLLPPEEQLSGYETYILLSAIELHDTGNLLGRMRHEKRLLEVVKFLGNTFGTSTIEKRGIQLIASAHGGYIAKSDGEKDRDTIAHVSQNLPVMGHPVRAQLLAAILRLADELADDQSRAIRFGPIAGNIPEGSKVFHKYALSLHSVMVNVDELRIDLHFEMSADDAIQKWGKGESDTFLLDEIYERTLKTYFECVYCMRYIRKATPKARIIEAVRVEIEVLEDLESGALEFGECLKRIEYVLRENGYPGASQEIIFKMCKNLRGTSPETPNLDGARLKQEVEQLRSVHAHE